MPAKNQQPEGPSYLDEHHQRISEFANDYFDDEEEREAFVSTLMERKGYKRRQTTSWDPPDPAPAEGNGAGGGEPAGPKRPAYFKR